MAEQHPVGFQWVVEAKERGARVIHVDPLCRRGARSHGAAAVAGGLLCAGALSARWSTYRAGLESASDPRYVVGPQRRMIERGERQGASRRSPRVRAVRPDKGSPATAPIQLPAT